MKPVLCALLALVSALPAAAQWEPAKAAAYLDGRMDWWITWQTSQRDHQTFCVSCHTAVPYALGRPALRAALHETGASAGERALLDNVAKRVRMWKEVEPFYADSEKSPGKTVESRGTEAILNALILTLNHHPDAKLALDNMFAEQLNSGPAKGAWNWLQFHNSPWEGDSQFYGAALAAVAIGNAPAGYPAQQGIKALNEYLVREQASQKLADRLVLLWASTRVPGLLNAPQRDNLIAATTALQRPDGGFSLSTFVGDWKRRDNTPLEAKSDGYATALAAFALEQAGVSNTPTLQRALQWLRNNQETSDGRWLAYSLNKQRDLTSDAGRFMSDAATAWAAMALAPPNSF